MYEFARALSGVLLTEQIQEATRDAIGRAFNARTVMFLPDADGRVRPAAEDSAETIAALDTGIAQWAFDRVPAPAWEPTRW